MSAVESRPLRRLLVAALSALTVLAGGGAAAQTADATDTAAAGSALPGWAPGPDGMDPQHNETLVRDER